MGQLAAAARSFIPPPWRAPAPEPAREPASDFGRLLAAESPERRVSGCLALLAYWLACADALPDPREKARLLSADPRELDLRESAKRAACAEDVRAFADAVHGAIDATDPDQRVQLLELLLVVRFVEGGRTGAENLLVRFLADAFGVRVAELTRRHERACGTPLGRLPRLDPVDWWLAPPDADDGEAIEGAEALHRRRLGLPSHGLLPDFAIEDGFERRRALADPARFDRLGRHERTVAVRLGIRLVEARDALLERAA